MAINLSDTPNSSWTTRQTRDWIRRATQDLNKEFYELQLAGVVIKKDNPLLYQQRNKLIELGTGKEYRGGVGLGLTYKTKSELIKQARALRETYNIIDNKDYQEYEPALQQGYETFIANRPGISMNIAQYKEMIETMGAFGEHALRNFGNSEDYVESYDEARRQGKTDKQITDAMVDTIRETKGQGNTTEDVMDLLREKIGLNE